MILDQSARMFRVECILYLDRYVLYANGIDCRRVDNLCAEVTQLHSLYVTQLVDGVGRLDHTWIGSHKSVNVGPYLQHLGIQRSSYDGCSIVATASSQVCCLASIFIATDESRHHSHIGHVLESLANQSVSKLSCQAMLAVLLLSADKVAAVHSLAAFYHCGYDVRRESLTVTNYSIFCFL